jgi:SAM-dependent methyltransferase
MAGRVRSVARHLPSALRVGLERSHQHYLGVLSRRETQRDPEPREFDDKGLPVPPGRLRRLVSLGHVDADSWLRTGEIDAGLIGGLVEANNRPLDEMAAILDFGCGCGRIARWWEDLEGPQLYGCDYDGRLTDWCKTNLPFLTTKTNASEPPLPFKSETFDLIYAISLFTHLTANAQQSWLLDVRRLLKPGGLFLFTLHGERFTGLLTAEQREAFAKGELVVLSPELSGMEGCAAFHPPRYVRDQFLPTAGLELLESVHEDRSGDPAGPPMALQDNYLARKPWRIPPRSL